MKKLLLLVPILTTAALTSCTSDSDCEFCYIVVKDSSGKIIESNPAEADEYCGSELSGIKAQKNVSPEGNTSEYVCE